LGDRAFDLLRLQDKVSPPQSSQKVDAAVGSAPETPTSSEKSLHIVVAEPNPITRWVYRTTLETVGYSVAEANDGVSAAQVCKAERPDLVLASLRLPDMDAGLLAQRARGDTGNAKLPVLGYSVDVEEVKAAQKRRAALSGFLIRPFLPSYLVMTIQFQLREKIGARQQPVRVQRAALSQETYSEKARRARSAGRGERILVVEDSVVDREDLKTRLTAAGFQVEAVSDGVAAMKQALLFPFDAIVTDTIMPEMDGFELCLMTRLIYQMALVPILMIPAGHFEEVDRQVAYALGVNAVVSRRPDFHKVVDSLLVILSEEPPTLTRVPTALPPDRRDLLLLYKPD
jgi:CheY-like chemotaxis protein